MQGPERSPRWQTVERAGPRELACNQPAAAGGKGAVDLGCKSACRSVRVPLGQDRLVEPGRPLIGGLSLQLDGRQDLYPGMNWRFDLNAVAAERHEHAAGGHLARLQPPQLA